LSVNPKTRGNYRVTACIRFDCKMRGDSCNRCIGHNRYVKKLTQLLGVEALGGREKDKNEKV